MKTLNQYINESTVSSVEYLGYSFDEMVFDYKHVEDIALRERKELGKKYGLDSGKTKEIQNAILIQMREERKTRKEFNDEDVKMFWYIDSPDKKKLPLEGIDFIIFLKDFLWKRLVDKGLDKKVDFAKGRDWNYRMTYAQRTSIMSYLTVAEYLVDNDPKVMQDREDHANMIDAIKLKLVEQTVEFHDEFIEKTKRWADKVYDAQEEKEEKYFDLFNDVISQLREIGSFSAADKETVAIVRDLTEKKDKYSKILSKARAVTVYSKTEFIKKSVEDAESAFNTNITALANKISDKGLDATKLNVTRIDEDPKYFELCVTDGTTTLYARSILAAEYSEKVSTHFRFIITDRKNA